MYIHVMDISFHKREVACTKAESSSKLGLDNFSPFICCFWHVLLHFPHFAEHCSTVYAGIHHSLCQVILSIPPSILSIRPSGKSFLTTKPPQHCSYMRSPTSNLFSVLHHSYFSLLIIPAILLRHFISNRFIFCLSVPHIHYSSVPNITVGTSILSYFTFIPILFSLSFSYLPTMYIPHSFSFPHLLL